MANSDLVQALLRGLDIMRLIAEAQDGLRVNEVAEMLSVRPPTAHNLLRTLSARKMVEKKRNKYVIGPGVLELASRTRQQQLSCRVEVAMKELAETYSDAVITFSEFSGGDLRVMLRISPDRVNYVQKPENQNFHPYVNASGVLFQAFADDARLDMIQERYPFDEYGVLNWKSYQLFLDELKVVRTNGYAVKLSSDQRFVAIAAPVFAPDGMITGTLGMRIALRSTPDCVREDWCRGYIDALLDISQNLNI